MPRPSSGVRLWLRKSRTTKAGVYHPAVYIILDGTRQVSTGVGPGALAQAEAALQRYLTEKHDKAPRPTGLSSAEVFIADLIAEYVEERRSVDSKPRALVARAENLVAWWGDRHVADITAATCKSYWLSRTTPNAARREMEDLSAAINLGIANGRLRDERVIVTLPPKPEARTTWLGRNEMARFIWDAWTFRQRPRPSKAGVHKEGAKAIHPARHVAKFALAALYTAGRASRIYRASYVKEAGRPYVDLEHGVYYRKWVGERKRANKQAPPIRIPARLLAHMRRWAKWDPETGEVHGDRYVCEVRGRPVDPKLAYARAMARSGIAAHRHTLRHSSITWLARSGVPVDQIIGFAGISLKIFESTYSHHHPDFQDDVSQAFTSGRAGRAKSKAKPNKPLDD